MITDLSVTLTIIEVARSEFMIRNPFGKNMVSGDEQHTGDCDHGPLGAATSGKASVAFLERGISFFGGSPSRLGKRAAKPAISLARMSSLSLACTFVAARANTCPSG